MKLMRKAVPQMREGRRKADMSICLIHFRAPHWAYMLPPKYPLTGEVAAYTKIAVDNSDPRSVYSSLCTNDNRMTVNYLSHKRKTTTDPKMAKMMTKKVTVAIW